MPFILFGLVAGALAVHAHHEVMRQDWIRRHKAEEERHKELLAAIEAAKVKT